MKEEKYRNTRYLLKRKSCGAENDKEDRSPTWLALVIRIGDDDNHLMLIWLESFDDSPTVNRTISPV